MAIYVGIRRYLEKNNMYYYVVETNDFDGAHFYIRVDRISKILDFFETSDCIQEAIYTIDYNDPDSAIKAKKSSINLHVAPYVVLQVLKAFKNNYFPECLDFCA